MLYERDFFFADDLLRAHYWLQHTRERGYHGVNNIGLESELSEITIFMAEFSFQTGY